MDWKGLDWKELIPKDRLEKNIIVKDLLETIGLERFGLAFEKILCCLVVSLRELSRSFWPKPRPWHFGLGSSRKFKVKDKDTWRKLNNHMSV